MLLSLGHGQRILRYTPPSPALAAFIGKVAKPGGDQVPEAKAVAGPETGKGEGRFGYLFPSAPGPSHAIDSEVLDRLADAMIDQASKPDIKAIAPIFTYFGQFIDHDITANTDRDIPGSLNMLTIDQPNLRPLDRSFVVSAVTNLRDATLRLDSLYGDGGTSALEAAMRDGARMRVGDLDPLPGGQQPVPMPADGLVDLPRVGPLVSAGVLKAADVPAELLTGGVAKDSRAALVGDGRNDENLIVAQLHVAFLRFHNAVLDAQGGGSFETAQAFVRHTYQWLVVNAYLPAVADKTVVAEVIAREAPIYQAFYDERKDELKPGQLPMPLEFSVAAFRYGHSLIRGTYDFNLNFTPATFELLFAFTGHNPVSPIGFGSRKLPANWPIDWNRFLGRTTDPAFRFARAIDTALAPPLADMVNQNADKQSVFRHLARRNLRRGWLLNLPTAQSIIASMTTAGHAPARVLTADEITDGPINASTLPPELKTEFGKATPLWFYILREAEVINGGARLGPVGSRIIAETLVGLLINDPESYWHLKKDGGWKPADAGVLPVADMESFLKAAGVLL